jgi:hypothetical protein
MLKEATALLDRVVAAVKSPAENSALRDDFFRIVVSQTGILAGACRRFS